MQRRMWLTVRWEREQLEIMWRLPMDGVPLAGNSHISAGMEDADVAPSEERTEHPARREPTISGSAPWPKQ